MPKIHSLPHMPSSWQNGIFRLNFIEIPAIPEENMARCPQLLRWPQERQLHRLVKGSDEIPQGTVGFGLNTQWVWWLIVFGTACTATTSHVHRNTHKHPRTHTVHKPKQTKPPVLACLLAEFLFYQVFCNLHKDKMQNPNSEFSLLAHH